MKSEILVVDDDELFREALANFLEPEGFSLSFVQDGLAAIEKLSQQFSAIILELCLAKLNGLDLIQTIRQQTQVPILVLTSRKDDIDRYLSFEHGADDFLSKPCNPQELLIRLRSLLRRSQKNSLGNSTICYQNITLDCAQRSATQSGFFLELTNTEFNILEILLKSPDQAFSKEELTLSALGRKYTAFDRSIDVHISNLRNKLGFNSRGESLVKTVRGFGYKFNIE